MAVEGDTATFTSPEGEVEKYQRASTAATDSANGQAGSHPVSDGEAQKRTVADLRNTGTAMFSWLTDQVGAAAAGQAQTGSGIQMVYLQQYTPISHKELERILVPQYLQAVPETDGWGHAYEFYLNAANVTSAQVMSIRSSGRDGRFSATDYSVSPFAPTDFDQDIVWADGFFIRWPQAASR